jgi:hypothetical protein
MFTYAVPSAIRGTDQTHDMRLRQDRLDGDSREGVVADVVLGGRRLGASTARGPRPAERATTRVGRRRHATDGPGSSVPPNDRERAA